MTEKEIKEIFLKYGITLAGNDNYNNACQEIFMRGYKAGSLTAQEEKTEKSARWHYVKWERIN